MAEGGWSQQTVAGLRNANSKHSEAEFSNHVSLWPMLPARIRRNLEGLGIPESSFVALDWQEVKARLRASGHSGYFRILEAVHKALRESSRDGLAEHRAARLLRDPACSALFSTELHAAAGCSPPQGRSTAGPTPTQELELLARMVDSGNDIRNLLDEVAAGRARAALAHSSRGTYASHCRVIDWACSIVGESPVPASTVLISRIASVVNHPSTLRGWLAAWRDWHIACGEKWQGDQDHYLRKIRKGTERLTPQLSERGRLRFQLWAKVIRASASFGWIEFGALCNLSYLFALRVPSELLSQCTKAKLRMSRNSLQYGPIRRKGKLHPSTLTRWCICNSHPVLCWHHWIRALLEARGAKWS